MLKILCSFLVSFSMLFNISAQVRKTENFNKNWRFILDDKNHYSNLSSNLSSWRTLNVPHDWSIELPFDSTSPTGNGGGALRGGMGWYTKEELFVLIQKRNLLMMYLLVLNVCNHS